MENTEFREKVQGALSAGRIVGDGHTLFMPEFYADFFTEEELREAGLIQTHESDGTHKGSIYTPEGEVIKELTAVYNLSFLYWVASGLGITKYPISSGRGSQAQELVDFICEALS